MGFTIDMVTGDFFEDNTASNRNESLIDSANNNGFEYSPCENLSHVMPNSNEFAEEDMIIPESVILEDIDAFFEELDAL